MFTYIVGTSRPELVISMISYLMTNMSTLQVKLMWVGESREKGNTGELQQREHLNKVKKLGSAWPYYTYFSSAR